MISRLFSHLNPPNTTFKTFKILKNTHPARAGKVQGILDLQARRGFLLNSFVPFTAVFTMLCTFSLAYSPHRPAENSKVKVKG